MLRSGFGATIRRPRSTSPYLWAIGRRGSPGSARMTITDKSRPLHGRRLQCDGRGALSWTWCGSSSPLRARSARPPSAKWWTKAQILNPGPVVERLGDDVPRCPGTLECDDMDASFGVEREELDNSPEPGLYLPAPYPRGFSSSESPRVGQIPASVRKSSGVVVSTFMRAHAVASEILFGGRSTTSAVTTTTSNPRSRV